MQSLFRVVLGLDFERLAPALRRHYDVAPDETVLVQGEMDCWNRFAWARLLIPFAPKNGKAVPVRVRNRALIQNNAPCFEWHREFRYPSGTQTTYTLTKTDPRSSPACVLDTFNQPPNIGVTLKLSVSEDGKTLMQTAAGAQYALVGGKLIALPSLFNIHTVAIERAIDSSEERVFTEVVISHPLFGRLFGYSGTLSVKRV
ncbi:MAG: DUF4166 domain-containing protein [Anaerolineae bacterium]|nr:DUF4166 domain-containing protein [Anaerolineae bacterium]